MSERRRFDGVTKIVRFNWPFYALSCVGIAAAILLLNLAHLPSWLKLTLVCGIAVATFWTISSLFVSWYVYDYVGVTRWEWLRQRIPAPSHRWLNIHAGLDESTSALRRLFPGTIGTVVDIYDSGEMTEPSIARARQTHPSSEPFKAGRFDALPAPDGDCDAVFLLFAAHEVRAVDHRTLLLREAARLLKPNRAFFISTPGKAGFAPRRMRASPLIRNTPSLPSSGALFSARRSDEAQLP